MTRGMSPCRRIAAVRQPGGEAPAVRREQRRGRVCLLGQTLVRRFVV